MKKVFRANLYFLIILLMEIFMPFILAVVYKVLGVDDIRIMLLGNHTVIFLVPAIIFLIVTKSSPKETLKLNKLYCIDALIIIILAVVSQPILSFFSILTSFFFNNEIGVFISDIVATPCPVLLSLLAIMPAITEEVTVRGVVLSGYREKNIYISALITGLFFGILHLDPQQFLYTVALGIILALLVRITNTIFSACLLHFLINAISVTSAKIMYMLNSSMDTQRVVSESADVSLINLPITEKLTLFSFYGLMAIVSMFFVYMLIRKLKSLNIKRGIMDNKNNNISLNRQEDERIINWPLICIIIIYLIVMAI